MIKPYAGIPGMRPPLLEEFGVQLVTYDLPGFGESDPHPDRNLNTSALDMLYLANSLGIREKFWIVGYSGGAIHAWAAVRYIPGDLVGNTPPPPQKKKKKKYPHCCITSKKNFEWL
jgi:pimeloyl-ACP methyl ester carboxylesterase